MKSAQEINDKQIEMSEQAKEELSCLEQAVLEANSDHYDPHEYLKQIKTMENPKFRELYTGYREKYGAILKSAL